MEVLSNYGKQAVLVDAVLEIRICSDVWNQVRQVALLRGKTYSWVVRYTVFRLFKRQCPQRYIGYLGNPRFQIFHRTVPHFAKINSEAWERRSMNSDKHRHRLCLYGEDELFIRVVAANLRCSITHLVRVALLKYLSSMLYLKGGVRNLRARLMQEAFLFWLGIKMHAGVEFPTRATEKRHFNFKRFHRADYYF